MATKKKIPDQITDPTKGMLCKVHLGGLRFTGFNMDLTIYHNGQEIHGTAIFLDDMMQINWDEELGNCDGSDERDERLEELEEYHDAMLAFADRVQEYIPTELGSHAVSVKHSLKAFHNIFGSLDGDDQDWWTTLKQDKKPVTVKVRKRGK